MLDRLSKYRVATKGHRAGSHPKLLQRRPFRGLVLTPSQAARSDVREG